MPNYGLSDRFHVNMRLDALRSGHPLQCRAEGATKGPRWSACFGLLTIAFLALALSACSEQSSFPFAEEPTSTPELVVEAPSSSGDDALEAAPDNRQLVIWLPDFAGYDDGSSAGKVLQTAFRQFEQKHTGVRVDVQEKAVAGQSDILSYLRSGQRVAPAILPDLVLVDSQTLWQLADLGLLGPMESPPMVRSPDFYQFALDSARYNDAWYGIPYSADVIHLAGLLVTEQSAPETWGDLLTDAQPYLYATAGSDVYENGSVLLQYVGAGGQLLENGSTSSEEALRSVFNFVVAGGEDGVIPETVMELGTLDGVWNALMGQGWGIGNASAARYLSGRESSPELGYAQIPTRNGLPATLGTTWSLVVLGDDEEQRALAFELIDDLLDPAVQGAWSQYANRLPTQRTALQAWSNPSDYTEFLNRQLEVAVALPNGRAFADFAARVIAAQQGVLRGELTPQEAVVSVRGPS